MCTVSGDDRRQTTILSRMFGKKRSRVLQAAIRFKFHPASVASATNTQVSNTAVFCRHLGFHSHPRFVPLHQLRDDVLLNLSWPPACVDRVRVDADPRLCRSRRGGAGAGGWGQRRRRRRAGDEDDLVLSRVEVVPDHDLVPVPLERRVRFGDQERGIRFELRG